ncbi:MAG: HAMP domain-containing histidine kinase [Balneolaceae bacterium]|nr:HAMP domain-containing histidine kinase [Balneolaceae bacterium]
MYNKLTLRNRIFLISSLLVLLAYILMWVFVRPEYKKAIINERTTIVSQLQEYSLRRSDQTIRNWLNSTNYLAEQIIDNPADIENLTTKTINLTPGLMRIVLSESGSDEALDIKRSIYNNIDFSGISRNWKESRIDPRIKVSLIPNQAVDNNDDAVHTDLLLSERVIQIGNDIYILDLFFDASPLIQELTQIPLGGEYVTNILTNNGENIVPSRPFEFPKSLTGEASYSDQTTLQLGKNNWFVMSSRFETIPYWHAIAVEDNFILKPVNDLIVFSALAGAVILFIMFLVSWYVSDRINRPVERIIHDVEYMSELDFNHPVSSVHLPEFETMEETLENIRLTLLRYQKLNVEKIILEEWKNKYMMTYSEDLIGILDADKKFDFLNNNFVHFLENLKLNPNQVHLEDFLQHDKIHKSKLSQTVHYPEPFTVQIDQAEVSFQKNEEENSYYDFQYVSIVDENNDEQAALVILHDKTKDRLLDIKRNDMINIIVHELKNPISGVVGLSNLLLNTNDYEGEEQDVLMKEIYLSGERMNTLVNRFLDVQRLESGHIPLDFIPVDLLILVEDIKSVNNSLLNEKNLTLDIEEEGEDFSIYASKDHVYDAIQNILSNAIKYGDPNRTIMMELNAHPNKVSVSITDYGYGISVEDQSKIFDKFFRVKSNRKAARQKGTGLGLAYIKEIVNRHHGDITLESDPTIGCKFTLIFPRKQEGEAA